MTFPREHRAKLHSTNPIERLNGEIKRRTDVVGIFPNEAAITRFVGAILMEQSDEWAVRRARYMTLETMVPVSDNPIIVLSAVPGTRPAQANAGKRRGRPQLHHHLGHHLHLPASSCCLELGASHEATTRAPSIKSCGE